MTDQSTTEQGEAVIGQAGAVLAVPDVTRADIAFGNIDHMPKFDTLPEDFRRERHPCCDAVSSWFFSGAQALDNGIKIDGGSYIAKPGIHAGKALAAIKAVLASWEPKHEHKIAACGFMLSQWFEQRASETHTEPA